MRTASFGHWNLCRWKNTSAFGSPSPAFQAIPWRPWSIRVFLEQARKEVAAASRIPTHEEVRRMTAKDASSWSEAIIAEREERF